MRWMILWGLLMPSAALAGTLELDGMAQQGALLRGTTEPGTRVTLDGKPVRVAPDGHFIFGFGRDAPEQAFLELTFKDGSSTKRELSVAQRSYDIQRINGLAPQQVNPDTDLLARIKREGAAVSTARASESDALFFEIPLRWPALGPITGIYGSQRILNGEPRQPHFGIDIAAPAGSAVLAAGSGKVTLAEHDLYLTGGTIVIDHG